MKKDIKTLIEKITTTQKRKKVWSYLHYGLSCVVFLITIHHLTMPAMTYSWSEEPGNLGLYKITLKDSFQDEIEAATQKYAWKNEYLNTTSPEYTFDLYFEDEKGNLIKGKDITIEVGPNALEDNIYAFGEQPITSKTDTTPRGKDLIKEFNLNYLVTKTGEKYEFVEAKIQVDDTGNWYSFQNTTHWHVWCQYSNQNEDKGDYGWRGEYLDANNNVVGYKILHTNKDNFKYKFIYQKVRYGNSTTDSNKTVESLGLDSGITFQMFNYSGSLATTGDDNINNNGIYDYFAFRDSSLATSTVPNKINDILDADGFGANRAKVESKLDEFGYPVFDCQGQCTTNPSLGYLFGSTTNPVGETTKGVTSYTPNNTLLQKEVVNGVEYYYYDSNRNAVDYDIENNYFMVRNYKERGQSMTSYATYESERYEFIPFNYWNDNKQEYTHTTNGMNYNYTTSELDHWYGMTMEFEFYMPRDGQINGEDMIFSFSGDDDVWIFIDNVLVLDLGGTHGAVDGNINFKTGEVEAYLNWNGVNNQDTDDAYTTTIYEAYTDALSTSVTNWQSVTNGQKTTNTYENYTKHTLKFFYLERGAAVSNCKIRFNIPVLPPSSLSVKKEYEGTENYGESFGFTLYNETTGLAVNKAEYTLKAPSKEDETKVTDEFGNFSLKVGEEAIFSLDSGYYSVKETNTGDHATSYSCSLDGVNCHSVTETGSFEMTPESTHQAVFTNTIKTLDLKVSKIAYDETTKSFDFKITVKNKFGSPVDIPSDSNSSYIVTKTNDIATITFSLKNEESITIKGIPIDTEVTLQEINHDGYQTIIKTSEEETLADGDTYKFTMAETNSKDIVVHNIPGITLPETGGTGTLGYLIIGTLLTLTSSIYMVNHYFNFKESNR